LTRTEGSTFHRILLFGNDFLCSRSFVATDILFGPSTFTKEVWVAPSPDVIFHYGGSSRLAWTSVGARQFGGSAEVVTHSWNRSWVSQSIESELALNWCSALLGKRSVWFVSYNKYRNLHILFGLNYPHRPSGSELVNYRHSVFGRLDVLPAQSVGSDACRRLKQHDLKCRLENDGQHFSKL